MKPPFTVGMLTFHRNPEIVQIARDCYHSVVKNTRDFEFIIVDNGSTIKDDYFKPDVHVFNKENTGIAHGWNQIISLARADHIAIINDDIQVVSGWLERMKGLFDYFPRAGMTRGHIEHLPAGKGRIENYKWFSGSCFMISRNTVEKVGLFDERFEKANFEDRDYVFRTYKAGLKCYVDYTGPTIRHKEGATVHDKDISSHFMANRQKFIEKWGTDGNDIICGNRPMPF